MFIAYDLFLFFAFWEISLLPLYFLIGIWGYENRVYATTKFFIITQGSGLLMLLAILGLVVVHWQSSGVLTFDYLELIGTPMSKATAFWLMLGFFIAFAVKLPVVPFHTWLPDAHTQAPTAGSVALAGLVLKIGAYGMLRFVVPLFPGGGRGLHHRRHDSGGGGNSLRRLPRPGPDRPETDGGVHQHQPHGLRSARDLRVERAGPSGGRDHHAVSRLQRGRVVHDGRRPAAPHPYA